MQPEPTSKAGTVDPKVLSEALRILPLVLELCETSPLHFLQPIPRLCDQILPSLINGQFRLILLDNKPVAFINWAWLSPDASERFEQEPFTLKPDEWQSGTELWFCEIIAHSGMLPRLVRDLQCNIFPNGVTSRRRRFGTTGEQKETRRMRIPKFRTPGNSL